MSVKYILYNPLSCNGKGTELAQKLTEIYKDDELKYCNMTQISGYGTFFDSISPESDIVLCGGDGTLNRFINDSDGYPYENPCIITVREAEMIFCVISARSRAVSL